MSASDSTARQELGDRFGRAVMDHPDVMAECKLFSNPTRLHLLSSMYRPFTDAVIQPGCLRSLLQIRGVRHVEAIWTSCQIVDHNNR